MIHGLPLLLSHSVSEIYQDSQLFSGTLFLLVVSSQPILYLFKSSHFEVFYYLHVLNYILIMYIAILHEAELIFLFGLLWLIDISIRYLYTNRQIEIQLQVSPCQQFVELNYVSSYVYKPSQYAFIMIPDVSFFESHPFSYVSTVNNTIKHVIKVQGSWTRHLRDIAKIRTKLHGFVEAPYGGLPWSLQDFKVIVMISGGIGCTPNISILQQLTQLHAQGFRFLRIEFLWTLREKDMDLVDMVGLPSLMEAFLADTEAGDVSIASAPNDVINTELYFTQSRILNGIGMEPECKKFSGMVKEFSQRLNVSESLTRVALFAESQVISPIF